MVDLDFDCRLDFPVIQYLFDVKIISNNKTDIIESSLLYDYVTNEFYSGRINKFQKKISRGITSYLCDEIYEKAKEKSYDRIDEAVHRLFVFKNAIIDKIKINKAYPYVTSYNFKAILNKKGLDFIFDDIEGQNIDIRSSINDLYDSKSFVEGLMHLGKMKFDYKLKEFGIYPNSILNIKSIDDSKGFVLARDLYNNLVEYNSVVIAQKEMENLSNSDLFVDISLFDLNKNQMLVIDKFNKAYLYTPCLLNCKCPIFDEMICLPFLQKENYSMELIRKMTLRAIIAHKDDASLVEMEKYCKVV